MDPQRLREFLKARGEPAYRAAQVLKAVYQDGVARYAEVSVLPAALREALERAVPIQSLEEESLRASRDGTAYKAVLSLRDGLRIETVLMAPKPGHWTACISSQVGCALRCDFCATGLMGLRRNLTAEEIADQVLYWRQAARRKRLGSDPFWGVRPLALNVVYMGMGEPFQNLEAVSESIRALADPGRFGLGQRHIAVSTAGLAPGIVEFGRRFGQVHLALSLHAAEDGLRSRLVPVNKAYPLARLREALQTYFTLSNQKVFVEYVLLAGENDGVEHAGKLAAWLKSVGHVERLHVNLIVFNPTDTPHAPSRRESARRFRDALTRSGIPATIRKNLAQDIEGACGQLIVKECHA